MKTHVGTIALLVAATCVTSPLVSAAAQHGLNPSTAVKQDVGRLILLTGPNVLSAPHGAPPSTSKLSIQPTADSQTPGTFRFVPASSSSSPTGKPTLILRTAPS